MKKFIGTLLTIALVLSLLPLNVFSNANSTTDHPSIEADFQITSQWDGFFNAEIKVKNLSNSVIENWQLSFDFPHKITNIWNAQVLSWENDTYLLKNMGWNINIDAGSEISFGFTAAYDDEIIEPSNFKIVTKIVEGSTDDYPINFKVMSDWGSGFSSQMEIHNNSDEPIEAWKLKFDFGAQIDTIWGAEIISHENGTYFITNAGYNSRILPGESLIIGFNGSPGNVTEPINYVISHSANGDDSDNEEDEEPVAEEKLIITAFGEYAEETSTIDLFWFSTISDGSFDILTSDDNIEYTAIGNVANLDSYSLSANLAKKYIKVKQTTGNRTAESAAFVVTQTPTGYAVDFIDSDNDGLYDYIEDAIRTDKTLPDTDDDGLSDYEEVYAIGSAPLVFDSVTAGVSDGEADCDNDGLSNRYELDNGTNPLNDDTDSDELKDGAEVNTYSTDPKKYDTDEDGAKDGWENINGYNPLVFDEYFSITKSVTGENIIASADIELSGCQTESLTIDEMMESPFLNLTTPGYIGSAF